MTFPLFGKLQLLCIAITFALGACGGGSDSPLPAPAPVVVVPPVPDNKSVLTLQLMDLRSQGAGTGPLRDNPYDSFSFLLNGNPIVVTSPDIDNAKTYPDLRSAIESAVNALKPTTPALINLSVTLGPNFTRFDLASGLPVVGQSILLTNTGAGIIRRNLASGWFTTTVVPGPGGIYNEIIEGSPESQ